MTRPHDDPQCHAKSFFPIYLQKEKKMKNVNEMNFPFRFLTEDCSNRRWIRLRRIDNHDLCDFKVISLMISSEWIKFYFLTDDASALPEITDLSSSATFCDLCTMPWPYIKSSALGINIGNCYNTRIDEKYPRVPIAPPTSFPQGKSRRTNLFKVHRTSCGSCPRPNFFSQLDYYIRNESK